MKQDLFEKIQETDIVLGCGDAGGAFYPKYISALSVRRFSGPCRVGPAPGVNGILFVHSGSARIGGGLDLGAPLLVPVSGQALVAEKSEGWLVSYRPVVINQGFACWPEIPDELADDPYAARDRELLEAVLPVPDSRDSRHLNLTVEEDQFVLRLFANMTDLLENKRDVYWPCRSRSYFLEVLLFFWRRPETADACTARSKAQRVHDWLRVHYPERVSLADLSRRFGSNRTTLSVEFRREYGESIMDELAKIRIDAATTLMRNTELSLSEIGARAGFRDYSNFYREFRRRRNATPNQYRNQVKTVRIY